MLLLLGELFADFVFLMRLYKNVILYLVPIYWKTSNTHNEKTQDIVEKSRGFPFHKQKLIIINDTYYLRINVLVKMNT